MKVLTVIGARPQFIESTPASLALQHAGVQEIIVHTRQHYDQNMSAVFFQELEISESDNNPAWDPVTTASIQSILMERQNG